MALTRYTPFHSVARLQDDMNRWFEGQLGLSPGGESFGWSPTVDVYEDVEGVTLKFHLPEVDAKDLDIRLEDGTLTVKGERKLEHEEQRDNYHRVEASYGTFIRSFSLPATLDFEKIKAESKNGVLRIFLPKRAEAKPRSVQVKVN